MTQCPVPALNNGQPSQLCLQQSQTWSKGERVAFLVPVHRGLQSNLAEPHLARGMPEGELGGRVPPGHPGWDCWHWFVAGAQ